jgi:hypothetical protein
MARGWESKEVESQIDAAESRRAAARSAQLSEEEIRIARERESLEMSRRRVLKDIETVTHERYRQQLQSALKHLDQRLAQLDR